MRNGSPLAGGYVVVNEAFVREKAARNDPRNIFYRALLNSTTYEGYLGKVGETWFDVATHPSGPISGRMEIRYCRDRGSIEDKVS